MRSFVNIIATPKGGTHVCGLRACAGRAPSTSSCAPQASKANEDSVVKDDVLEGLTGGGDACAWPSLSSRGRPRRCSARPRPPGSCRTSSHRELTNVLTDHSVPTRPGAQAVLEKVAGADAGAHRRAALQGAATSQERARDLVAARQARRLPQSTTSSAPSCSSSRATAPSAPPSWRRSSEFQALLPIRGKILNVQKASVSDMLKNS